MILFALVKRFSVSRVRHFFSLTLKAKVEPYWTLDLQKQDEVGIVGNRPSTKQMQQLIQQKSFCDTYLLTVRRTNFFTAIFCVWLLWHATFFNRPVWGVTYNVMSGQSKGLQKICMSRVHTTYNTQHTDGYHNSMTDQSISQWKILHMGDKASLDCRIVAPMS